jgi:hypothetical protein
MTKGKTTAADLADLIPITIRIPPEVHEWIKANARKERRSLNSQIVLDLERLMAQDSTTTTQESHP